MTTKNEVLAMASTGEGCLGRAAPSEPVFVLRAQDQFAPALIESWAAKVDVAKGAPTTKAKKARALAHQMRAWQELNSCKVPD